MPLFNLPDFFGYLTNGFLLRGVLVTLALTMVTIVGGLVLGMLLALLRMARQRIVVAAVRGYIWIFRGTPLLIQLVIIYTGLPQLGLRFGVVGSALLALILNEAAYLAEIIRSGFMGVPRGQYEAAGALGLPKWLVLWKVTLPQAFRLMLPSLGNSVNGLLKSTSITSVISMEELMRRSQMLMQEKFEVLEVFCAAAIFYLLMTTAWGVLQQRLERHFGAAHEALRG
ncbi:MULTISPECIES: amino acid ABC transporter permease [Burkholderiaceae]|uniref:amino acid ABC transporter permease n=1 Tax=Burkholderiaceae TaxID=119060 RepID=UPI0014227F1E|nr:MULTISPECIES: amino acid ABC transporter permease [Burkholderiaceae]NIF55881.1 amino acid ABC transporter permease [Burkholderia sp. Ax-1724]NIF79431.1 amino acid ABC transporter permease [Paraburkholderia sp. Cy-641]